MKMHPNTKITDKKILSEISRHEQNVKIGISVRGLAQKLGVSHPTLLVRLHKMVELGKVVALDAGGYAVAHRKQVNGKSSATE